MGKGKFSDICCSGGIEEVDPWRYRHGSHSPCIAEPLSKPLEMWKTKTKKGCVRKVLDDAIKLSAIELLSENTSDSYIYTAPEKFSSLGISLPILVLIVKNVSTTSGLQGITMHRPLCMDYSALATPHWPLHIDYSTCATPTVPQMNKYFSFRISIMDDRKCRRTFRISNFQTVTRLSSKWCTMPMVLNEGWNLLQINLNEYTEKAFRTKYVETLDIQINASIRIRCVYFCDRIYNNEELKDEFKIFSKKKEKCKYTLPQNLNKALKKTAVKNIVKAKTGGENLESAGKDGIEPTVETVEGTATAIAGGSLPQDSSVGEGGTHLDMVEELEEYNGTTEDPDMLHRNDEVENYLANVIGNAEGDKDEELQPIPENEHDDGNIGDLTEIKSLEMDLNNVLYEEVTYDKYNNDES
ncbi:transcription factor IIb, putative [Plasmodium ovale curtisi]|uniref:Transcription factor IIb, putative n=1 Tax=Plasmodium ovale curtisi TaxID=864141 RepID=A0A1A8W0C5_PLAOA|nr:transcription factor IIb, putative [Plasmodium ovale curtisi]SBS93101.1 transcription factor IIb, putative [Plasmodium ovale curtisi]